jgi:hypothetical protein
LGLLANRRTPSVGGSDRALNLEVIKRGKRLWSKP